MSTYAEKIAMHESAHDHGNCELCDHLEAEAAKVSAYAGHLRDELWGIRDAIANGLKFDGAKWLLFESGRDSLLERIDAALAKNPQLGAPHRCGTDHNPLPGLGSGDAARPGIPAGSGHGEGPTNSVEPLTVDLREMLKAAKCPNPDCWDGAVPSGNRDDPDWSQCQWCFERAAALAKATPSSGTSTEQEKK